MCTSNPCPGAKPIHARMLAHTNNVPFQLKIQPTTSTTAALLFLLSLTEMRTAIAILVIASLVAHACAISTGDAGPGDTPGPTGGDGDVSGSVVFTATGEVAPPDGTTGVSGGEESLTGGTGGDTAPVLTATGAPGNGSLSNSTDSDAPGPHIHHHHRGFWSQFAVNVGEIFFFILLLLFIALLFASIAGAVVLFVGYIIQAVESLRREPDYRGIQLDHEQH